MNEDFVAVPLKSDESALPVYSVAVPQFAYSNGFVAVPYEPVKLDDNSRYEVVPMRWVDERAQCFLED